MLDAGPGRFDGGLTARKYQALAGTNQGDGFAPYRRSGREASDRPCRRGGRSFDSLRSGHPGLGVAGRRHPQEIDHVHPTPSACTACCAPRPSGSTARSSTPTPWPSGCRRTASPARCTRWTPGSAARYRMSFTNFGTGRSHSFGGEYLELVPHERIRHTDGFDDPNLPGQMQVTVVAEAGVLRHRAEHRAGRHPRGDPARGLLPRLAGVARLLAQLVEAEIRE